MDSIFPFNIITWLFDRGSSVGNWFKSLGADVASGIEGGFISILKDLWQTIRPFTYLALGVIIMLIVSFWFFTGEGNLKALAGLALTVAK